MKRNYMVYFSIYGKNLKAQVLAESEKDAAKMIRDKLNILKVEKLKDEFNDSMDSLDHIIDALK